MQILKGQIEISMNAGVMITDIRSGNLLVETRDIEGSAPTDRVVALSTVGVKDQLGEFFSNCTFKEREIDKYTFGDNLYDRLIEINMDRQTIAGMLYWSSETGDYKMVPSTISMTSDWKVVLTVMRTGDAQEIVQKEHVDWDNMSKIEKYDFILSKFSQLLTDEPLTEQEGFELATHKHYKGGLYRELGKIRNADDGSDRALYLHLHPHELSAWHRDTNEFNGFLEDSRQRFAPIEDELPFILNDDGVSTQVHVVLRKLSDEPISGIKLSVDDTQTMLSNLNERANTTGVHGEFGQPAANAGDNRFQKVEEFNQCCSFTNFSIQEVVTRKNKRVSALAARVQPSGLMAMDFLDSMRKNGVGFAMRCFGESVITNGGNYLVPKQIITFDFVVKKK